MILTCPACETNYVVKDGAIPTGGRKVRCASCKHSWHQEPEEVAEELSQPTADDAPPVDDARGGEQVEAVPLPPQSESANDGQWTQVEPASAWEEPATDTPPAVAEEFEPFYDLQPIDQPKRKWPLLLLLVLLVALAAIAFWFLAPAELRQRVGIAQTGQSQLHVVLIAGNYQRLASGNNLFTVSGRIVNSTDNRQPVPPLQAELLDDSKQRVVHRWTISPPASSLDLNKSASFNSAEVDVPDGGKHIRVRLGGPA